MARIFNVLSLLLIVVSPVYGFQFMKGWKMPIYDPKEEATNAKFGDKSKQDALLDTLPGPIASN